MLLNLTDLSSESLQSQIARQIRAKILAGELPAGAILPSIRGLAKDHKVSVVTVQRGYESLERQGLIHSRRGKGFFVSDIEKEIKKEMAMERLANQIEPIINAALEEGLLPEEIMETIETILAIKE